MNTRVTSAKIAGASPRTLARITGALYLVAVVTGVYAQAVIAERLVIPADAAATAANIRAHASLFRLGFTTYLVEMAAQVAMITLFYHLLEPVSRTIALLSTVVGLVGCTVKTVSRLLYYAPLVVLSGAPFLAVFSNDQLNALSLLFLKVNDVGAGIALAFFGFATVLKGYLILRSTFLPRLLGVLSVIAGVGWLTFLWPSLGGRMFLYVAAVGFLGSVITIFWLLVYGVDEQRWREQSLIHNP
jgi:hypothetical protein